MELLRPARQINEYVKGWERELSTTLYRSIRKLLQTFLPGVPLPIGSSLHWDKLVSALLKNRFPTERSCGFCIRLGGTIIAKVSQGILTIKKITYPGVVIRW